jgi:hypothetical protein
MTKRKNTAASSAQSNAKASAEAKTDAAKTVGVDVSAGEIATARKEGALQAERDAAADSYTYATDGNLLGDPDDAPRQFTGYDEIMQYSHLLGLGPDEFEAAIAEDATPPIPDEKVYGLLALERNGQNRTPYVQAAITRLDLKPNEMPGGGPAYTNDVRPTSELHAR